MSGTGSASAVNMTSQTARNDTIVDEPAKSNPRKSENSCRVKLQRARPRIVLLITCIAYLITAFTTLNIGSLSISNFINSRLKRAQLQLRTQSNIMHREQALYGVLDTLVSSRLDRGFMESHEHCLVRGLQTADQRLFGLGFQHPDICDQVVDWTMENCGRLQFTPQVIQPTPRHAVLTYWAKASYRSRQLAERALGFKKYTHNVHVLTGEELQQPLIDRRSSTPVPFGFQMLCTQSQPCRLFYPKSSNDRSDKETVSGEALVKTARKVADLNAFCTKLNVNRLTIQYGLIFALMSLQMCLVIVHIAGMAFEARLESWMFLLPKLDIPVSREQKYGMIWSTLQAITSLVYMKLATGPSCRDDTTMIVGLAMSLLGFSMLARFFFPGSKHNAPRAHDQVKELYLIIQGRDIPGEKEEEVEDQGKKEEEFDQTNYEPHHRIVSPHMTIQEDIRTAHIAMQKRHDAMRILRGSLREMQDSRAIIDSVVETKTEPDTESNSNSDSDSEFDNEGSIDLAGGITPSITDTVGLVYC
ncbi:hypothetical protein EJ02DRAFT_424588 [Clathrospora elynae]|uniref:Uncharacterized protein n=1 Tax=Clathrospora elynae TaxID=706981 RepID=A0A6A5SJS0_9PLEO|nr:hypothetical protein EJ02DRAFT_424588 [Clathrospora elynae]